MTSICSKNYAQTINVPRADLIRLMNTADSGKACFIERDLLIKEKTSLQQTVVKADSVISAKNRQLWNYKNLVDTYEAQKENNKNQINELNIKADYYQKQYKKQVRKTKFAAFVGILTTGAALTLFIMK